MIVDITAPLRRAYILGRFPRPRDYARAIDISTRGTRTADYCADEESKRQTGLTLAALSEIRESVRNLRASLKGGEFLQGVREALTGDGKDDPAFAEFPQ